MWRSYVLNALRMQSMQSKLTAITSNNIFVDNIPNAIDLYKLITRFIHLLFVLINQLVIANLNIILFVYWIVLFPRTDEFQLIKLNRTKKNLFSSRLRSITICLIGAHRHGVLWHWYWHKPIDVWISVKFDWKNFLFLKNVAAGDNKPFSYVVLSIRNCMCLSMCGILPTQPSALPISLNTPTHSIQLFPTNVCGTQCAKCEDTSGAHPTSTHIHSTYK